jgi:hypothetical protein
MLMLSTKIENPVTCEVIDRIYEVENDRQAEIYRHFVEECGEGSMNEGIVEETMSVVQRRQENV